MLSRKTGRLLSHVSAGTARALRDPQGIHFFPWGYFCLGVIPGLFFGDGLVIGAFALFSIPVESPMDKRGKSGSGNRGLGFAIGADYRRFFRREIVLA